MTLQEQARRMVYDLMDGDEDHLPCNENRALFAEWIEEELRKAYRAGQAAALDRKGIQKRLDIMQEIGRKAK